MTAAAAAAAGFAARSADGDVGALAALVAAAHRPGAGAFLHVRGRHAAGDLAGRLAAVGVPVRAAEIYAQVPQPLASEVGAALADGAAVALFSPRSAALFAAAVRAAGWPLAGVAAVSLSAAVDAALDLSVAARIVAARPTRDGMLEALAGL
jgi:uroporphyrinogen-III synthase